MWIYFLIWTGDACNSFKLYLGYPKPPYIPGRGGGQQILDSYLLGT